MAQPTLPDTSTSPEPYWLGRASDEQKRLLKQHTTWTRYTARSPSDQEPPNTTQQHRVPRAPVRLGAPTLQRAHRRHRNRHGHMARRHVPRLAAELLVPRPRHFS